MSSNIYSISFNGSNPYDSLENIEFKADELEVHHYRYFDDLRMLKMKYDKIKFLYINGKRAYWKALFDEKIDAKDRIINLLIEAKNNLEYLEID